MRAGEHHGLAHARQRAPRQSEQDRLVEVVSGRAALGLILRQLLQTVQTEIAGWPTEVSLDVEWAHATAPGAKIVLVIAPTADDSQLVSAVRDAVHDLGDLISNSYGEPEALVGPATAQVYNAEFRRSAAQGLRCSWQPATQAISDWARR